MSDNADTGATETTETTTETTSAADAVAEMAGGETTTTTETTERPENVPEKFWDAESKSVRTDDVLKSYTELEGKFGSFTGAPDEYAVGISDELKEQGLELDADDPMVDAAKEFAKNAGMNQEGFTNLLNLYGMNKLAEHNAQQEATNADIASLGDNADRRLNNLNQWASKNLPEDLMEGFKDAAVSADAVKAMEQLVSMTRNAPVQVDDAAAVPAISQEEVTKMQFAKDDNGNRKIQTDPAFKAEYERKRDLLYGTEEFREVVG